MHLSCRQLSCQKRIDINGQHLSWTLVSVKVPRNVGSPAAQNMPLGSNDEGIQALSQEPPIQHTGGGITRSQERGGRARFPFFTTACIFILTLSPDGKCVRQRETERGNTPFPRLFALLGRLDDAYPRGQDSLLHSVHQVKCLSLLETSLRTPRNTV